MELSATSEARRGAEIKVGKVNNTCGDKGTKEETAILWTTVK